MLRYSLLFMWMLVRYAESQSCSAFGSLHFLTFDGKAMDFRYPCQYVLTRTCSTLAPVNFDIRIKNAEVRPAGPVTVQYVEITAEGKTLQLHSNGRILSNGIDIEAYNFKCKLKVQKVPMGTELTIVSANVSVTISDTGFVLVKVPSAMKTYLCGICGNFDDSPKNDRTEESYKEWFIADLSDRQCSVPPEIVTNPELAGCMKSPDILERSGCGWFKTHNTPFSSCASSYPDLADIFYHSCLYDICTNLLLEESGSGCGEDGYRYCANFSSEASVNCVLGEAFAVQCYQRSRPPSGWRNADTSYECPKKCPSGSTYNESITACPEACGMNNQCRPTCTHGEQLTEGCSCNGNSVWSGSSCVSDANQCGSCTYGSSGLIYPDRAKWMDATCSAEIECINGVLNYTSVECAPRSECKAIDSKMQCACSSGYIGDGRSSCIYSCGAGFRPAENNDYCEACSIGTYQPIANATICLQCPPGQLTLAISSTASSDCIEVQLLPYNSSSNVCSSYDCLKQVYIPVDVLRNGIPFGSQRCRYLSVSSNGIITCDANLIGKVTENLLLDTPYYKVAPLWFRQDFRRYPNSRLDVADYTVTKHEDSTQLQLISKFMTLTSGQVKSSFTPVWALVATWQAATPYPFSSSLSGAGTYENVTYQAMLATDGHATYAAFLYPSGGMHLSTQALSFSQMYMGYNTGSSKFSFYGSGTQVVGQLDKVASNTASPGKWIFEVSTSQESTVEQRECLQWYAQQQTLWQNGKPASINCPCDSNAAAVDPRYLLSSSTWCAVSLSRAPPYNLYQMCCYDPSPGATVRYLLTDALTAGRPLLYNPYNLYEKKEYSIIDAKPFENCCRTSNNCPLYREYRPADDCTGYLPPWPAAGHGDPHFETFDGQKYTYNAIGEFHLVKSSNVAIQARMAQFKDLPACEFDAIAVKATESSRVHIELNSNKNGLIIYVKSAIGEDLDETNVFFGASGDVLKAYEHVTVAKIAENELRLSFDNGYAVDVAVDVEMLQLSLYVPQSEKTSNSTYGLMGFYDGIMANDLMLPNRTVVYCPKDANYSWCVATSFGRAWRITAQESIFWYRPGFGTESYTDESFVPLYLDDFSMSAEQLNQASSFCKDNRECVYDFTVTRNDQVGLSTLSATNKADTTRKVIGSTAPAIQAPKSVLRATVGVPISMIISVQSGGSGRATLQYISLPVGAIVSNISSNEYHFEWTPTSTTQHLPIRFVVVDSESNASSSVTTINVALCTGCEPHGKCLWPSDEALRLAEFISVACRCDSGWTGEDCNLNYDVCQTKPCVNGNCTDLSHVSPMTYNCSCEQGFILSKDEDECLDFDECAAGREYVCSDHSYCVNSVGSYSCQCSSGYEVKDTSLKNCTDVDECSKPSLHLCEQTCSNLPGSYACTCFVGFELSSNNFTCLRQNVTSDAGCSAHNCTYACMTTTSGVECLCPKGFFVNGSKCEDVNECTNLCNATLKETCHNTPGSYECRCHDGYQNLRNNMTCTECLPGSYGPDCSNRCNCGARAATCDHVIGCTNCTSAWTGDQCSSDVDECSPTAVTNACPDNSTCNNTLGSYTCSCPNGYKLTGTKCVDIDECLEKLLPCGSANFNCLNTMGSFMCSCLPGFKPMGQSCSDIDECESTTMPCHDKADCKNTLGSYTCHCSSGYLGDGQSAASGGTGCVLEDGCNSGLLRCAANSACRRGGSGYECVCDTGYTAIGKCCVEHLACFQNRPCEQVEVCCNTDGKYTCNCTNDSIARSNSQCHMVDAPGATTPASEARDSTAPSTQVSTSSTQVSTSSTQVSTSSTQVSTSSTQVSTSSTQVSTSSTQVSTSSAQVSTSSPLSSTPTQNLTTPPTDVPSPPISPTDYLPLYVAIGVLAGLLLVAVIAIVTLLLIRRYRQAIKLHRNLPPTLGRYNDAPVFGDYLSGLFRPVGQHGSLTRRSNSSSSDSHRTSSLSSDSTASYHDMSAGRVGRGVPFGPRWPTAYARVQKPISAPHDHGSNEDDIAQ